MSDRIYCAKALPEGYKACGRVYVTLQEPGLLQELMDTVILRVSQTDSCAYCIDMHIRDRAAFAWEQTLTCEAETHVPDTDYEDVAAKFGSKELPDLTCAIGLMCVFNRFGRPFRTPPSQEAERQDAS
jgi:alkylhydroperoxidase family enzyme